jgi:hypothetical protein
MIVGTVVSSRPSAAPFIGSWQASYVPGDVEDTVGRRIHRVCTLRPDTTEVADE